MIESAYLSISAIGFIFFFRKGRTIDILCVGFIAQQIYFMPLILQLFNIELIFGTYSEKTYYVASALVLVFILFSTLPQTKNTKLLIIKPEIDIDLFSKVCALTCFLLFVYIFTNTSGAIFNLGKTDMLKMLSYDYLIWSNATILAVVSSFYTRRKLLITLSLSVLFINVYIGFRSPAAITVIASAILYFSIKRTTFFSIKKRHFFLIFLLCLFFFSYKGIYMSIKTNNYDILSHRVSSAEFFVDSFINSEPSLTTSILSNVLKDSFRIDIHHAKNILISLGFFGAFGVKIESFNSIIQPIYYAKINGGVGSNVWANIYSIFGYVGLYTFMIIYCFSLYVAGNMVHRLTGVYKIIVAVSFSYWAFYIHRNDLSYQLSLEKRVIIIFTALYLLTLIIQTITIKQRPYLTEKEADK